MLKKLFLFILTMMVCFSCVSNAAALMQSEEDKIVTNFKFLALNEINVKTLISSIDGIKFQIVDELQKKGKSSEKINADSNVLACELIKERLVKLLADIKGKDPNNDIYASYVKTMRIWYSLEASVVAETMEQTKVSKGAMYLIKMAIRLLGKPFVVRIPSCGNPDEAIGAQNALKEAAGLYDKNGKAIDRNAIASMTHRQVSALEPLKESHVYRASQINPIQSFSNLEKEVTELTRICPGGDPNFDLEEARSVFMLAEVKTTATSPKIAVKDKFGFSWKMKWGNEVHTEILATRLYCALGGRYADLKYNLGAGKTLLVLAPENNDENICSTLEELVNAFKNNGIRNFKMMDWVAGEGLKKDSSGKLLGHGTVDEGFLKKYNIKKKYLGAWYVWFKESSVSFNAPCAKRLGAAAFSDIGALDSRTARGSIIFNMFLMNFDAKDANSKMVLLYNPASSRFDIPIEYQHDLGCTLTASVLEKLTAGEINELDWDWMAKFPGFIGFKVGVMYHPEAWKKATYADAMWMARKMCSLDPAVFEWLAKETGWPEFAQSLVVERMKARRNELIDVFNLSSEGFKPFPINRNLTIKVPAAAGVIDTPVLNGIISPASESLSVREAEALHPEGIYKTTSRFDD